jgi:hypothetical protein
LMWSNNPVDPARSGKKLGCSLLILFYLLKQHRYDLKK